MALQLRTHEGPATLVGGDRRDELVVGVGLEHGCPRAIPPAELESYRSKRSRRMTRPREERHAVPHATKPPMTTNPPRLLMLRASAGPV